MAAKKVFFYIIVAFGMCQLITLAGDVMIFLTSKLGGPLAAWLLPSSKIHLPGVLAAVSDFTVGWIIFLQKIFQSMVNNIFFDSYGIATTVVAVAVLEEIQYRGPLRILLAIGKKNHWSRLAFVILACGVNFMFMLPHTSYAAVFVFSTVGFAACATWLLWKTEKLWPCMVLHGLFNLYWLFGKITVTRLQLF